MRLGTFTQQPKEAIRYTMDYGCWLDETNSEALTSVTFAISPTTTPALVVTGNVLTPPNQVGFKASGGTAGVAYKVEVTVETSLSQIKQDEVMLRLREF